jgi:hypothetical protein
LELKVRINSGQGEYNNKINEFTVLTSLRQGRQGNLSSLSPQHKVRDVTKNKEQMRKTSAIITGDMSLSMVLASE